MKFIFAILLCTILDGHFIALRGSSPTNLDSGPPTNKINSSMVFQYGQPKNGILAGMKFLDNSQSNVAVCLFQSGQSNKRNLWVAPPEFRRVDYFLYDSSNKFVPYLTAYHPENKDYHALSEVPKNAHNVPVGLMWGPPFTMPYDHVDLNEVFDIRHNGDYKLVARTRILKVNHDLSLTLTEFPPVSLQVHIQSP